MELVAAPRGEITAQVPAILWETISSTARDLYALLAAAPGMLLDLGRGGIFGPGSS